MFSIFVYSFTFIVSFVSTWYFYVLWKKQGSANYWEFSTFFLLIGISSLIYTAPFFYDFIDPVSPENLQRWSGVMGELGNFVVLAAFAFVLRAFVRFQGLSISPNLISFLVVFFSLAKPIIGFMDLPRPVLEESLIYWHFSRPSGIAFAVLVMLFCFSMAGTFFSNLGNIKRHRKSILFLGTAFFFGGFAGMFIVNFNSFGLLLSGYLFLLVCFFFFGLFMLSSLLERRKTFQD